MSSHKQPVQIIYCMQALLASSLASLSLHSHTDIGVYDSSRDIVRYSQTVFLSQFVCQRFLSPVLYGS